MPGSEGNLPVAAMLQDATKPKVSLMKRFPLINKLVSSSIMLSIYLLWATLFYGYQEGWSRVDAIYFAAVTMSTVGYGDLYPSDNAVSEIVTVFFIFFGITAVFGEVSSCVTMLLKPFFLACRSVMDKWFPQKTIDLDGDGGSDFKVPRGPGIYYTKNLLAPFIVIFFGQWLWAIGYWRIEGGLYRRWWYHCMTTFTTVGYGDVTIQTDEGKIYATVHLIFSVSLLGSLISEVFALMASRADQLKRAELLKKRLDPELIKSLDKDGKGVDRTEFVLGMLYKLDIIVPDDAEPYIKQFDQLDADGSGLLTSEDLELATKAMTDKLAGRPAVPPMPKQTKASVAPSDAMTRVEVAVRRGEQGLGFTISASNVIDALNTGFSATEDGLRVGDIVIGVDGRSLLDAYGNATQLKEALKEMQKLPEHRFLVERTSNGSNSPIATLSTPAAGAPVPLSPMYLSPAKLPPPAASEDADLRTSIAYAWGAMGLPKDQMQMFIELLGPAPSLEALEPTPPPSIRPEAVMELPEAATPPNVHQVV